MIAQHHRNARRCHAEGAPVSAYDVTGTAAYAGTEPRITITDLTPTGRGSGFVRVSQVSLEEVLRSYDAAYPDHTEMAREDVVFYYLRVQREWLDARMK